MSGSETNGDTESPPADLDKQAEDLRVAKEEREVKRIELEVRRRESEIAAQRASAPWWRRADPLALAVMGAFLTILGNMLVGYINNVATVAQAKRKAADDLALETRKGQYTLILQAIATNDAKTAARNINFFIATGLLDDKDGKIHHALSQFNPVLPSATGPAPSSPQAVAVPEIARLYNFPADLDGDGQVIGMLEFGGGFRTTEVEAYFAATHRPAPNVLALSVGSAKNAPGDMAADAQIMTDIEITGAIAPRASLRVYFATFSAKGWVDAIHQATADRVTVLLVSWGQAEKAWVPDDMDLVNNALESAAKGGMTVVCAAGDGGVSDRIDDGLPHVDFPASSPWVLSVGGTSLVSRAGRVTSETVWNSGDGAGATGGGVSDKFERPDWQAKVSVPGRKNGTFGRGVPDVAATAWDTMAKISIAGNQTAIGGTTVSAGVWTGLIALLNQGLGHNLGYFNERLYSEVGPAGVLRPITQGNNGIKGLKGYSAAPGWNPVSGWGTPDGAKLLEWLRDHP
jgi:kumamolisin